MLLTSVIMAFLTAVMVSALLPLSSRLANMLTIVCLFQAQIVLLAEVLSELRIMSGYGFWIGHLCLLGVVALIWHYRGRPNLLSGWKVDSIELREFRRHPLVLVLFGTAIVILTAAAILSLFKPYIFIDSLTYNLPRAYYWVEQGTARHYSTENFRQIEFPPNASFVYAWVMALSQSYRLVYLPQWLTGWTLVLAVMGLARLVGHSRPASLFAGVVGFAMPEFVLQMFDVEIDLFTGMAAACFVLFTLRSIQRTIDTGQWRNNELIYAGISFGLLFGSKLTAFFLMPSAAITLAAYLFWRMRLRALRLATALVAACLLGFVLFASYNYVLNLFDFGNPLSSAGADESADLLASGDYTEEEKQEFFSIPANLARYTYQTMDWKWASGSFFDFNAEVFKALDRTLSLDMTAVPVFDFDTPFGNASFGYIGYALVVAAPFALVYCLIKIKQSPKFALSAVLLAIGWGWLVTFSAVAAWSPWRPHLFLIFLPLLMAALLPWLYSTRRIAYLWLVPINALTIGTMIIMSIFYVQSIRDQWLTDELEHDIQFLKDVLPADSRIGIVGDQVDSFSYIRALKDHRFVEVYERDVEQQLLQGEVDLVLAQRGYCDRYDLPSIPLTGRDRHDDLACIYTTDPAAFEVGSD